MKFKNPTYLVEFICESTNSHWQMIKPTTVKFKQEPSHQQSVLMGVNWKSCWSCSNSKFFSIVFLSDRDYLPGQNQNVWVLHLIYRSFLPGYCSVLNKGQKKVVFFCMFFWMISLCKSSTLYCDVTVITDIDLAHKYLSPINKYAHVFNLLL